MQVLFNMQDHHGMCHFAKCGHKQNHGIYESVVKSKNKAWRKLVCDCSGGLDFEALFAVKFNCFRYVLGCKTLSEIQNENHRTSECIAVKTKIRGGVITNTISGGG